MQEISTALATAATAARIVKNLQTAPGEAQATAAIIQLQDCLLGLQSQLFEIDQRAEKLTADKRLLRAEIERMQSVELIQKSLAREGNAYFRTEDGHRTGPFCLTCWDTANVLVNLIIGARGVANCGRCAAASGRQHAFYLKPMSAGARNLGGQAAANDESHALPG